METGTFTDDRDGREYRTVRIGGQTWLAGNLARWMEGARSCGGNPNNDGAMGLLYNWKTARRAAPEGWRLPSNREWDRLLGNLDETDRELFMAGGRGMLRGLGGFALPGGFFKGIGRTGYWWSASEAGGKPCFRAVGDENREGSDSCGRHLLLSVRLVRI